MVRYLPARGSRPSHTVTPRGPAVCWAPSLPTHPGPVPAGLPFPQGLEPIWKGYLYLTLEAQCKRRRSVLQMFQNKMSTRKIGLSAFFSVTFPLGQLQPAALVPGASSLCVSSPPPSRRAGRGLRRGGRRGDSHMRSQLLTNAQSPNPEHQGQKHLREQTASLHTPGRQTSVSLGP